MPSVRTEIRTDTGTSAAWPPKVAVIVAFPPPAAVRRPSDTVATAGSEDSQSASAASTACIEPSDNVAVTMNCVVSPMEVRTPVPLTSSETTVGAGGGGGVGGVEGGAAVGAAPSPPPQLKSTIAMHKDSATLPTGARADGCGSDREGMGLSLPGAALPQTQLNSW